MTSTTVRQAPVYLSPAELSSRWNSAVKVSTLALWRTQKSGPIYTKLGGKVLYDLADIENYEDGQRRR